MVLEKRPANLGCTACHANLASAPLDPCPRCGAENRAWQAWASAERREHLDRFFLRSPWGRLALVSLLLPPVSWAAFGFGLFTSETLVLFLSSLLSLTALFLLYTGRDALWTYELTRGVTPRFRPGLLLSGGLGFLIFIGVAGGLVFAWGGSASPDFTAPASRGVMLVLGLAFVAQPLGAGLYAVYAYGRWLSRTFPRPVFLDEARLLGLVLQATRPRIQVKTGATYEAVTTQVAALARTDQAGLNLLIRAEAGTDEVWEGQYLKSVQHWRVVSDKWGRVTQLKQQGPLEYVPDPGRAYKRFRPEERVEDVLDGEIILADRDVYPR